jgi:hypothetical protein
MSDLWTKCMAAWVVAFAVAASAALAQQASEEADDPQPSPAAADADEDADLEGEQADQEADEEADQEEPAPRAGEEEPSPPDRPRPPRDRDEPPADSEEPADVPAPEDQLDRPAAEDRGARDTDARTRTDAELEGEAETEGRLEGRADAELDLGLSFTDRDNRLMINNIEEQSALATAGIQRGDVLVSVNDRRISSQRDFWRWIRVAQPGSRIALRVLREGRPQTVFVRYVDLFPRGYREQYRVQYDDPGEGPRATLGVVLDRNYDRGAMVVRVAPGSPAERAGVRRGDIIVQLEGERVGSPQDLIELVTLRQPGDVVDIQVVRPLQARLAAAAGGQPPAPVEGRTYIERQTEFIEGDTEFRGPARTRVGGRVREGAILDRDRDGRRLDVLRPRN